MSELLANQKSINSKQDQSSQRRMIVAGMNKSKGFDGSFGGTNKYEGNILIYEGNMRKIFL